jgi:hypothetical protein
MRMDFEFAKVAVFTPLSHADRVRKALYAAGAGHLGNYDSCSFSVRGIGRFRPSSVSKPFIGREGKIEKVEEEKIEVICRIKILKKVLSAARKAHPYEEPAIDVYPLLNSA